MEETKEYFKLYNPKLVENNTNSDLKYYNDLNEEDAQLRVNLINNYSTGELKNGGYEGGNEKIKYSFNFRDNLTQDSKIYFLDVIVKRWGDEYYLKDLSSIEKVLLKSGFKKMAVDTKVYIKNFESKIKTEHWEGKGDYNKILINDEDKKLREEIIDNFSGTINEWGYLGFDGRIIYHFTVGDDLLEQKEYKSKVCIKKSGDADCLNSENKKDSLSDLEQFLLDNGFEEEKH